VSLGQDHRPLRDIVCDELRSRVISGDYPPGSHLVEDRLARDLGVSRNPVREALRVLQAEGFIDMIPRRGAVVATLSDDEVRDIFEVRMALERLAAQLAARRAGPQDVGELRRILLRAQEALGEDDAPTLTDLNTEFHELVLEISGNGYLRDVMLQLRGRMKWIFSRTAGSARGQHSLDEHVQLSDAIEAGEEDAAADLAVRHVRAAADSYWAARQQSGEAVVG
jgi:DNA-binding GntR family transcriptional regulator